MIEKHGGRFHTLLDSSKSMRLDLIAEPQTALIRLTRTDHKIRPVEFDLGDVLQVSLSKPWQFVARKFDSLSIKKNANAIGISGTRFIDARFRLKNQIRLSFHGNLLKLDVAWKCLSDAPSNNVAYGMFLEPGRLSRHQIRTARVTLPHILYNGNPSTDPEVFAARFNCAPGERILFEEHRFPIPCAQMEWDEGTQPVVLGLYSRPDPSGAQEWSLGLAGTENGIELIGASGVLAFNGLKDICYGLWRDIVHLENGYFQAKRGDCLRKTWLIEFAPAARQGHGFRNIIRSACRIFKPASHPALPIDRVIRLKINALQNRWHADKNCAGYLHSLPDSIYKRPSYFCYGWTGQSLRLAWCAAKAGVIMNRPDLIQQCRACVDFYLAGGTARAPGLYYNYYYIEEKKWRGDADGISSRAYGETITYLAKIISFFRMHSMNVPAQWTFGLRQAVDFLLRDSSRTADGIFPVMWDDRGNPVSNFQTSAAISCVLAVLGTAVVFNNNVWRRKAAGILRRYWKIGGDHFNRPFARATLDARCEDKEAGIYFFLAASELFRLTGKDEFREWAEASADWILTFVYFWHTGFRPGSPCARNKFITTGWPGVSVQNHHLDVFFPAYELSEFGCKTGNREYQLLGRLIFDAWSHGIATRQGKWSQKIPGEQGEQFYQTNFAVKKSEWRGGFNPWNPAWIIGLVLEAALNFRYPDNAYKTNGT